MPLTIRARTVHGIPILDLNGALTIGPDLVLFERDAKQILMDLRPARLLLDVHDLLRIDSAGLGEVMILYSNAASVSCRLALIAPNTHFRHVLRVTRLDAVVPWFEDEASALLAS